MHPSWLSEIKVVLFDLDGTLYQDDSFMDRYIRYMLEETAAEEEIIQAINMGRQILSGEHSLRLGHFYHIGDKAVLRWQDEQWIGGWAWDGTELDRSALQAYGPVSDLTEELIAVGDPWGVALIFARQHGVSPDAMSLAFDRVRQEMLQEPHGFIRHGGLLQALKGLTAVERKMLLTNTHQQSGIEFVQHMGLTDVFNEHRFGAGKPDGMQRCVQELISEGYQANEILSIGDNGWNDLNPVKRLGGRTCHISPYTGMHDGQWDIRVASLDELEKLMTAIQSGLERSRTASGAN